MGASDFCTRSKGKTAREAFDRAVDQAHYENGRGGYTGTIAEKRSFVMITVPDGQDPFAYASKLMDDDDRRIVDKWGPAGCIDLGNGEFYFFGWASC